MLSIIRYLREKLRYLRDERGIETVEYLLIGALITAMAVAIYPGSLQDALESAVAFIASNITGASSSGS